VANSFRSLSDDDLRQISEIIEVLNRSEFDHLELEVGDIKLTLGKSAASTDAPVVASVATPATPPPAPPAPAVAKVPVADTAVIAAPLLGRFYSQPEPGAPPFVTVGAEVTAGTTVALIEVMKTFNAVQAGIAGIITEVCAQDAQLVEHGQPLYRVRPRG
jgi:acetyl-CoA carboxylase biotin carboxyl carrier protein